MSRQQLRQNLLRRGAIGIDDFAEQPQLGGEIVFEIRMVVEMVAGQVGEAGGADALDDRGDEALVPHRRELLDLCGLVPGVVLLSLQFVVAFQTGLVLRRPGASSAAGMIHIAIAAATLQGAFQDKERAFGAIVKIGLD